MSKTRYTFITGYICLLSVFCWGQDAKELHETAKTYMRQGDYANASLVLTRALQQDPQNIKISKDLALDYFLQKENAKAVDVIKPLLDRDDVDYQIYQIAGKIYKALNDVKEAEKLYKKGIKKFPGSGPLYNDYGETLWSQGDVTAIKQWERGIEKDPQYSGNYYNAAHYYYFSTDKIWSIIYGEIFLNLETFTTRTAEMKGIMLENYKKLFNNLDAPKTGHEKNNFEQSYKEDIYKQSEIASTGITPETLIMIRTRFLLEWFHQNPDKYPFRLLDFHKELLQEGLFEAYNQWIFGVAQNLPAYQNWTITHPQEYNEFNRLQKSRIFKVPAGQYYHK